MNVSFKIYWNNPIEMQTEAGTQQLTFEVPLGAMIVDPSVVGDLSNYYTKAETEAYADSKVQQTVTNGVTIRVAGGGSLALTQQYSRVLLEYVGSNEWVMHR